MGSPVSPPRPSTVDSAADALPVPVGVVSEIPDGERRFYTIGGEDVAVLNVAGELYAIENSCPHRGGPIGEGKLLRAAAESTNPVSRFQDFDPREAGGSRSPSVPTDATARLTIGCPWHGWEFDLADGSPAFPAKRGLKTYAVWVEDNRIWLDVGKEAGRSPISERE